MPSVDTLDTGVHVFVFTLWALPAAIYIVGAVCLGRQYAGEHRSIYRAVDIGHEPAHAKPARTPWWARLGAALADGWREAAIAYALLRGVTL